MMNKKVLFVAGIGTGVGKTVASAILCEMLEADYWKPVQAGDLDKGDKSKIKELISSKNTVVHPEAYQLPYPVSPHASAEQAGITVKPEKIMLPETNNHLIIEGAGGLMVPLNYETLYIDWIKKNDARVILVSRHYLGSINHTLLSCEVLKARNIQVEGILFNGTENKQTEKVIEQLSGYPVLGRIDPVKRVTKRFVKEQALKLKGNEYFRKG
jgi:dethiobiotin synthetase